MQRNTATFTCACRDDLQCQYHARRPRPCPECRSGTLGYYRGADGGRLVEFALLHDGFAMRGYARMRVGRGGPARMCDRCDYCEAA